MNNLEELYNAITQLLNKRRESNIKRAELVGEINSVTETINTLQYEYKKRLMGDNPDCVLSLGDGFTRCVPIGIYPYNEALKKAKEYMIDKFGGIDWDQDDNEFCHAFVAIGHGSYVKATIVPSKKYDDMMTNYSEVK